MKKKWNKKFYINFLLDLYYLVLVKDENVKKALNQWYK